MQKRYQAIRKRGVHVNAFSSTRMVEACRIGLALQRAGLPIFIDNKVSYIDRVLDQDWVGVVAENEGISYGWQSFPQEFKVNDCIYFRWLTEDEEGRKIPGVFHRARGLVFWLPERVSLLDRLA